jgi:hypothetical protein
VTNANVTTMGALYKDVYPAPGTRIKQWVVDVRREHAWERETCPRIEVPTHEDNTGAVCRNAQTETPWSHLDHDCCYSCNDLQGATRDRADVQAWLAENANRPPIEADRTKLSDQVEPEIDPDAWRDHPLCKVRGEP